MKENTEVVTSEAGVQLSECVARFKSSMERGMEAIKEAASAYVDALMRHPTLARERFRKDFPGISIQAWRTLESIGVGDLNPAAFILPTSTVKLLRHIPIDKQNAMFAQGNTFKVVNPYTKRAECVPLNAMTNTQVEVLIDVERGCVRSEEAQREMIDSRQEEARRRAKRETVPPYRVVGRVAIINGVEISRGVLERILREIDKKQSPR